jgi:heme exporter protein D
MNSVDMLNRFSRRALFRILFYFIFLGAVIFLALFYGLEIGRVQLPSLLGVSPDSAVFAKLTQLLAMARKSLLVWVLPGLSVLCLLLTVAAWFGVRRTLKKLLPDVARASSAKAERKAAAPGEDKAQRLRQSKQMYLYLLSILQREGRILDFFAEDLSLYEDAQIGAAVRGIHESCKRVIDKRLSLQPVIDQEEGEAVTVATGFDPAAIKLVGNVSGEPPFKGILRHRGWQSKRDDLPTLSGTRDAGILAPAEVEI